MDKEVLKTLENNNKIYYYKTSMDICELEKWQI